MIWLKTVVTLLALAAMFFGAYDFHLHLINGSREEVLDASMLTIFFGVTAGVLGLLASKLRQQRDEAEADEMETFAAELRAAERKDL